MGVGKVVKRGFGRGFGRFFWKYLIGLVYLGRERVIDKNGLINYKFNKGYGLKGGKGFSYGNVSEKNGLIKNFFGFKSVFILFLRGRGRGVVFYKNFLVDRSVYITFKGRGRGVVVGKRFSSVSLYLSGKLDWFNFFYW